jgi:hypothetical protein
MLKVRLKGQSYLYCISISLFHGAGYLMHDRDKFLNRASYWGISPLLWLLSLSLFFLLSCSSEKPSDINAQKASEGAGNVPGTSRAGEDIGSFSLGILPENATRNSTLHLLPHGFSLTEANIEWLVNGVPVQSPPDQFKAGESRKGDTVQAKAVIQGKEIFSNTVRIGNTPPEVSRVKILPEVFKPGDTLGVEVSGKDTDGDEVTISYEWTKNGEPAGQGKQIEGTLRRGDKISVKIMPFDGEDYGRSGVLHREILNLPPAIIDGRKHSFTGNLFTYQVKANDPDGDPLTYSLKSAPSGMTINSSTGLVKWDVPVQFTGKTSFTISVSDGNGGEAVQTFPFEIRLEQKR